MGFITRMKQAEDTAHRQINRAMQGWDDLERRMRQHWRIYPSRKSAFAVRQKTTAEAELDVEASSQSANAEASRRMNPGDLLEMIVHADLSPATKSASTEHVEESGNEERKPIVSIHGKDVDDTKLDETKPDDDDSHKKAA